MERNSSQRTYPGAARGSAVAGGSSPCSPRSAWRSRVVRVAGWAATLLLVSCGSKGAVAVTATIEEPQIFFGQSSGLAAQLNGGFRVDVALGSHAPSGTDIKMGNFQLVNASQAPLQVLKFTARRVSEIHTVEDPPMHVEPGQSIKIHCTLADSPTASGQLVTKEEQAALCGAGSSVQLTGAIADNSGAIPVSSASFAVQMCP